MALKLTENALLLISLTKELIALALPVELNESLQYLWGGFIGLSGWLGYFFAFFYYMGVDYELGPDFCEFLGYGYYVIDGMNYIVSFAKEYIPKPEGECVPVTCPAEPEPCVPDANAVPPVTCPAEPAAAAEPAACVPDPNAVPPVT